MQFAAVIDIKRQIHSDIPLRYRKSPSFLIGTCKTPLSHLVPLVKIEVVIVFYRSAAQGRQVFLPGQAFLFKNLLIPKPHTFPRVIIISAILFISFEILGAQQYQGKNIPALISLVGDTGTACQLPLFYLIQAPLHKSAVYSGDFTVDFRSARRIIVNLWHMIGIFDHIIILFVYYLIIHAVKLGDSYLPAWISGILTAFTFRCSILTAFTLLLLLEILWHR